jgi:DNA polymerase-3 subunit epsilon
MHDLALPSSGDACLFGLSLCSGAGGLDLGLAIAIPGYRAVGHVEREPVAAPMLPNAVPRQHAARHIGTTEITQGNINHSHIYLRSFFEKFPADAIGGSNRASVAQREIAVDWGGGTVVMTDLDGEKKFFRKRGWIREFFERHGVRAGDMVTVEEVAPYSYRVALQRRLS